MHLKAHLNWHQLFESIIDSATQSSIARQQKTLGIGVKGSTL